MKHPDLDNARRAHHNATIDLIRVVQRLFPVGARLKIFVGQAVVCVEVTGHASDWTNDPEVIFGVNIRTGKRRKFRPAGIIGRDLE